MVRSAGGLGLVFAMLLHASLAGAQVAAPPDIVRLTDGSFLRGVVVESTPEHVVVILPTGETRTYPRVDVVSAGPEASPATLFVAPVPPLVPTTHLHASADGEGLSLQRLSGATSIAVTTGRAIGYATLDEFAVICNLPCDIDLPAGAYQLGVARGTGTPVRAGPPITFGDGDLHLDVHYDDRRATRLVGWLALIGGGLLGLALVTTSFFIDRCPAATRCGIVINTGMLISGGVIFAAGLIVGLSLVFRGDGAGIRVSPGGIEPPR